MVSYENIHQRVQKVGIYPLIAQRNNNGNSEVLSQKETLSFADPTEFPYRKQVDVCLGEQLLHIFFQIQQVTGQIQ